MSSILDSFRLDGKTALVTGASRGLGAAISSALAESGADVAIVDMGPLAETEAHIKSLGRKCIAIQANLSNREVIPGVIAQAQKQFGHVDILVNNAGIIRREDFEKFTEKDWDDVMAVNINAVFFLSQCFVREVLARKGRGALDQPVAELWRYGKAQGAGLLAGADPGWRPSDPHQQFGSDCSGGA